MKLVITLFTIFLSFSEIVHSQNFVIAKNDSINKNDRTNVYKILYRGDSTYRKAYVDSIMYADFWDTIPQTIFWTKLMRLSADSGFMSVAKTRQIIDTISVIYYSSLNDTRKTNYRDSLKKAFGLSDSTRIFFTTGKKYFYSFRTVIPSIDESIPVFIENNVDPWFAQSILLIESPNKLQKSKAGAYGPFQLMKYNARKYGLTINRKTDERKDIKRSAYAASMFINKICIPTVRSILDSLNISYKENDLWFRLLVMHVYHAGGGNVQNILYTIRPKEGGLPLIYTVWQTEAGSFRNASQNYSQVLIAALLEFHNLIRTAADRIQ
ncbi:MAG: hypothetical protein A2X08_09000 [Bacteroidetes bacterium GWA2_32_17]|nr:MAG: hypothetical protein A2X08_09000 [Bacteroidetes bacterium GWA2_32_17]